MVTVFLCGPWVTQALGQVLDVPPGRVASFPAGSLITGGPLGFPMGQGGAGAAVRGILVDAAPECYDRLLFLAEVLGWHVEMRGMSGVSVQAILPPEGAAADPWQAEAWCATWGDIAQEAVREIQSHHGQLSSAQVRAGLDMVSSRAASRVAARVGKPAKVRCAAGRESVDCVQREDPHVGYFLTRAYELRHPAFDGTMSPRVRREVFVATDAAIVLPYDPVRDRVLLVEQFRMGPFGRGDTRPWMLEPVAGRVDAGEHPHETARRECEEEAGLLLRDLEHISSHYCSPGCSTEYFHLYLGLCDLPQAEKGQGGLESEDEDIRTHVLEFKAAMRLLSTGEADNGPLVLSLMWLQRERARLRATA
jgi:nudix-type nucleoside diphosphatase (YffH/AdpP family)